MFKIKQALSTAFLKGLVKSTLAGIESRDCFYDQFHYVNRHFIEEHKPFLAGIVAQAIAHAHPGIAADELVVVNDFVAPVNLENAQIHTQDQNNKYGWHIDGIDRSMGPCYNLWIPLYQNSALKNLDIQSLMDVLERSRNSELYLENGDPRAHALMDPLSLPAPAATICEYLGITSEYTLRQNVLLHCLNGRLELFPRARLNPTSVIKPQLGDVFVFSSNQYHASGPSSLPRIAISIKFLVGEARHGFRVRSPLSYSPLSGWMGVFLGSYYQFGDFTSYRKYLGPLIDLQQGTLAKNQAKLNCVHGVLSAIHKEL
jgi:hypothetical protein